jgi:hypothetical protein
MAGARAYLEGIQRLLDQVGAGAIEIRVADDDESGELLASYRLKAHCRLEVLARLAFSTTPQLHRYSFQLLDENDGEILRYDNFPYHEDLHGFPHHCHRAGKEPEGVTPAPSIRTILGAIEDEVEGRLAFHERRM